MTTVVTTRGALAGSTIAMPFADTLNAANAQAELDVFAPLVANGSDVVVDYPGGSVAVPTVAGAGLTTIAVTVPVASNLGILPNQTILLVDSSPALVAAIGGPATQAVVAGAGAQLVYVNQAVGASIYLGGGLAYVGEAFDTSSAVVNLGGGDVLGAGAAIVDGTYGATTVNVFSNALLAMVQGNVVAVAQPGTTAMEVLPGSNPAVPTIMGAAGGLIEYVQAGGDAVIAPGGSNLIVVPGGSGGRAMLLGGAATIGATAFSVPDFTGSATVFGGTGYFQGGSAGHNYLESSTIPGATTLVGGGDGDVLVSQAVRNTLIAGTGNQILATTATTPYTFTAGQYVTTVPAVGSVFYANSGGATTILGSIAGGDTIYAGSGNTIIELSYSFTGNPGVYGGATLNGSTVYETAPGGTIYVSGWANRNPGTGFSGSDVFVMLPGVTAGIPVVGGGASPGELIHLSDGTILTLSGISVFQIQQVGSYLI